MKEVRLAMLCVVIVVMSGVMVQSCALASDTTNRYDILELVRLLGSRDGITCDYAYKRLAAMGKEAIPYLLDNAGNPKGYAGIAYWRMEASEFVTNATVGLASLYLIECVLHESRRPHLVMRLDCVSSRTEFTPGCISNVIAIYRRWWLLQGTNSVESIRMDAQNPLSGSRYRWVGYNIHMERERSVASQLSWKEVLDRLLSRSSMHQTSNTFCDQSFLVEAATLPVDLHCLDLLSKVFVNTNAICLTNTTSYTYMRKCDVAFYIFRTVTRSRLYLGPDTAFREFVCAPTCTGDVSRISVPVMNEADMKTAKILANGWILGYGRAMTIVDQENY